MKRFHFLHIKDRSGVTLAEMMVAFGVFGIFISIALGGFMQSLKNQRVALVLMEANDAASIIFENIARQLRTAKSETISAGNGFISFVNYKNESFSYSSGEQINNAIKVSNFSSELVNNTTAGAPPRVVLTITMSITDPSIGSTPVYRTLRTTISPRIYYNLKSIVPERRNRTDLPNWF